MAFELSSDAGAMTEPLEREAETGVTEEAPGEDLLSELGVEFAQTTKPDETKAEGVADAAEEVTDKVAEEQEEVEEPKEEEPKGRAQKRIQALANEKNDLAQRLEQQNQEFQRQLQYVSQQQQAQVQALAQQNAILQRQLEVLNRQATPVEDESKLTPMEQYERKILREAETRAEAKMSPRLQQLENELRAQRAEKAAEANRRKQQASLQQYTERANMAAKQHLMSDVEDGVFAPEDASVASDMVLSYVAATGEDPEVAAQKFKMWLDKYHQGRLQRISKTSGKAIQKSQRVPAPMQSSKGTVQSESKPTWDALHKHGYDNYVQWMRAGSPPLSK